MIVNSQNSVLSSNNGTRMIVNDPVNYFLGLVSNDWNNPTNWSLGILPTNSQVAILQADCSVAITTIVKGIVIPEGYTLTQTAGVITILTNLENYGSFYYANQITMDTGMTTWNNTGTFTYTRDATQVFSMQANLPIPANLVLPTFSTTVTNALTMQGDLTIMGNYTPYNSYLIVGPYNLTIMGRSGVSGGGIRKNSSTGKVVLGGKVTNRFFLSMTNNPTVEMWGGWETLSGSSTPTMPTALDFTIVCKADQTFSLGNGVNFACTNLIADGCNVLITDGNTAPYVYVASSGVNVSGNLAVFGFLVKGILDGTSGASSITFNTLAGNAPILNALYAPMPTAGTLQISNANGYRNAAFFYNASGTVHPYWGNTFDYLYITTFTLSGQPVLSSGGPLTVSQALDIRGTSVLDMGNGNNLTVLGTTYCYYNTLYNSITGSGTANWLFAGLCTFGKRALQLNGASINLEFRGGIACEDNSTGNTYDMGNGTVRFTTNSQAWNINGIKVTANNVLLATGVTLTLQSYQTTATYLNILGSLEGADSTSKVICNGQVRWSPATPPMNTGSIDLTSNPNTFEYYNSSAVTLKYNSYWHLSLTNPATGTTAYRTVPGDLTLLGNLIINAWSGLILGSYNLTVNGTSAMTGPINKTSAGLLLFIGASAWGAPPTLTSDVSLEFRGGFSHTNGYAASWGGVMKFTTNNQTVNFTSGSLEVMAMLIDSGITITNVAGSAYFCTGSVTGTDATSVLINLGTIDFRAVGTLMATGQLYCDTAANTVLYNTTFGQTIRVPDDGNYRTLTLTGSPSTKTVGSPGTVNVRGVYTKNVGVTVVGTITNNP